MSTYTPDTWVMIKFNHKGEDIYKILAGWSGSYLYGSSWKLNSGVTKVEVDGDYYLFHGSSGSVYQCHKNCYGFSGYTSQVYSNFVTDMEGRTDVTMEALDEDTDFLSLNYE